LIRERMRLHLGTEGVLQDLLVGEEEGKMSGVKGKDEELGGGEEIHEEGVEQ